MSKCGFCGEDIPVREPHIRPMMCIEAYKKRIREYEKEISRLRIRGYEAIVNQKEEVDDGGKE